MLLAILFSVILLSYTLAYYLKTRSIAPLIAIRNSVEHLFKAHKTFTLALLGAASLHLWGHINLGAIAYNTSGFDMLTHTLFGFFVIGVVDRLDLFKEKPRRLFILFALVFVFHLIHELQEEVQKLIPSLASQVSTEPLNQARDLGFNLLGILSYIASTRIGVKKGLSG